MAGKFVLQRSGDGFRFDLQAGNGQVVLSSEHYEARAGALGGIESVKANAPHPERFELRQGRQEPYFVLKAANGQVIGTGEHYSSDSAAREGMAAVTRAAEDVATDDRTSES
ncbi:hypothetical protein DKM44_09150 [Deinococcus irradiatisoli]|uniref:DUF1508 domain-containing protein n=1 Tax=Deinococcus irradiatisoli TaxID=2202254 RepID=A0A2Z3JRE2_9DEIO|nr:YegP family protein [Deinococcus irradiatisoli]AWN23374.1 hypothetical protein DKM44_09150 [Deinococcus irradiatisoli]